jgi:hypothetical protein
MYIKEIVYIIRDTLAGDHQLARIFHNEIFYNQSVELLNSIVYIYIPINVAVLIAMWWDELAKFSRWALKKTGV